MEITCPYCGFSKTVATDRLSDQVQKATCPKCKQDFPFSKGEILQRLQAFGEPPQAPEQTAAAVAESAPKAGFWLRMVAASIDGMIVFALQFVLGAALGFAGAGILDFNGAGSLNLVMLIELFTYVVSFAYYIVFTGHGGQTPGKMALRIKVIRCNGDRIGYGRAAFREIPAKFISGIILGIGYLMIAFDSQKQGLHDRMADTYVIKL